MKIILLLFSLAFVKAHDYYSGDCPKTWTGMQGFDWDRFKEGRWYAIEKFDTSQSRCLTYDFTNDAAGFRVLEQNGEFKDVDRLGLENKYTYRGRITEGLRTNAGQMKIRFTLNPFKPMDFYVMDTDYDNYALVCNCQEVELFFAWTIHRRSCTILQRTNELDMEVSKKLYDILNSQSPDDDEEASHDFDKISHSGCTYVDDGKGVHIDVEKVLDTVTGNVDDVLTGAIDAVVSQVDGFNENEVEKFREEIEINEPLRKQEKNPVL